MLISIPPSPGASPALTLTIRFSLPQLTTSTSTQALSSSSLNITIYGPRSTYGGLTTETQKFAWGLALPISTSSAPILPAQIGITKSLSSEHSKKVEHAFTITGTPPLPLYTAHPTSGLLKKNLPPNWGPRVKSNSPLHLLTIITILLFCCK